MDARARSSSVSPAYVGRAPRTPASTPATLGGPPVVGSSGTSRGGSAAAGAAADATALATAAARALADAPAPAAVDAPAAAVAAAATAVASAATAAAVAAAHAPAPAAADADATPSAHPPAGRSVVGGPPPSVRPGGEGTHGRFSPPAAQSQENGVCRAHQGG